MSSARFYAELPVFTDFREVSRAENFAALPEDWHVVMSDVRNSTVAIQSGGYKNVNTVGAATITAVLNAAGDIDIPFVFEGDGSTLCVPPALLDDARAALQRSRTGGAGQGFNGLKRMRFGRAPSSPRRLRLSASYSR